MKRMNLRDIPDEAYTILVKAAKANRQSLNSFMVDRITETARVVQLEDYFDSYTPPKGTGITTDAAVAAVRSVREAS